MAGWVKLHRSILEWEWYDDTNVFRLFIHLILTANYEDKKWRGKIIKKGQLATSVAKLSEATGLTPKMVRGAIKKLEKSQDLVTKGANNYTLITVCNYSEYQSLENDEGKRKANEGQSKGEPQGNQRATTKEVKKEEDINTPPYNPPAEPEEPPPLTDADFYGGGGEEFSSPAVVPREGHPQGIVQVNPNSSFEQFWDVWLQATAAALNRPDGLGKDEGKEAAWLVWAERENYRQIPGLSDLMDALMNHSESHQWTKQGGQFIPSAENWLRKGKWADRLPKAGEVVQQGAGDRPMYNGMNINSVAQGITAENDAIARRKLEKLRRQQNDGSTVAIGQS